MGGCTRDVSLVLLRRLRDGEVYDRRDVSCRPMGVVTRTNRCLLGSLLAIWSAHIRTIPWIQQSPMLRRNFMVESGGVNLTSRARYETRISKIFM